MAFADLKKAFNRVPQKVEWWALRIVCVELEVKVGVHQGSVLSPLLFNIVLEALSREFHVGCPWEMLYADDLVILAETFECLMTKMVV